MIAVVAIAEAKAGAVVIAVVAMLLSTVPGVSWRSLACTSSEVPGPGSKLEVAGLGC